MTNRPVPGSVPIEYIEPGYLAIWLYLALLTAFELAIVYADLEKPLMIGLLVGTACAKAALVAMYFMHLRFERRALALVALAPLLIALTLLAGVVPDMATRAATLHRNVEAAWRVGPLGKKVAGTDGNSLRYVPRG